MPILSGISVTRVTGLPDDTESHIDTLKETDDSSESKYDKKYYVRFAKKNI